MIDFYPSIAINLGWLDDPMIRACKHLQEILEAQKDIIERHIDQHKWFMQTGNRNAAICDFVEKYGFIMREFYCSRVCVSRFECELAQQYKPK
jgi:hypothetical protein